MNKDKNQGYGNAFKKFQENHCKGLALLTAIVISQEPQFSE